MTGRRAALAAQLELEWSAPPTPADIAMRIRELDRELGTHMPPTVEVCTRRNRSTMGSLRLSRTRPAVWRYTVAADLLEKDPQAALDLGLLLLHRARKRTPPEELRHRLAEIRGSWGVNRPPRRARTLVEDPELAARLMVVAERGWPGLESRLLPAIAWVPSTSRRVLGRYDSRARRIELHEALRDPKVPATVIDNLIFHELLHALLGAQRQGHRLVHHHAEFRSRERGYPHFAEAELWGREKWPRLVAHNLRRRS